MTAKRLRSIDVLTAQKILTQKARTVLNPENVQVHSEAAALLLIWAANMIKLYACQKVLGPPSNQVSTVFKPED